MSAALLRRMLEEAGAYLKEEKYDLALDAARRVTQFDARNFQAVLAVGLASFHLQQWDDAEGAFQRAAELKPEAPAPWKQLVDLYEATGDAAKRIGVLEKLIGVFQRTGKIKASQKWLTELAVTAAGIKLHGKAFDAWYALVDETNELSLHKTANEELPAPLLIWLHVLDVLQHPAFSLTDSTSAPTMGTLMAQFFAVAQSWSWDNTEESIRSKADTAVALFLRHQVDRVKAAAVGKDKTTELKKLDDLALSVIGWLPTSKLAMEFLLLRSEDSDSPIDDARATAIATQLSGAYPKSPMALIFHGLALTTQDPVGARACLMEGLASCSASSFHESSLCVRVQVELASIALSSRDVEGCLSHLQSVSDVVERKTETFGTRPPHTTIYSDIKMKLMRAQALDLAGETDRAFEEYSSILAFANDQTSVVSASVGAVELLLSKAEPATEEAFRILDQATVDAGDREGNALLQCCRAWAMYCKGGIQESLSLFSEHVAHIPIDKVEFRARALKRMATVYWALGGEYRSGKTTCFGTLLQAAKLAPRDGEIFSLLGRWYAEIGQDVIRAEKCFLKALSLAPRDELAGVSLTAIYDQQGKTALNLKLWEDLTAAPESAPTWALLRLAQHFVDQDDEKAISKMHLVLRNDPLNSTHWVAMGHLYRHFGKTIAAQRSYARAIELGEAGWVVYCELARIEAQLSLYEDALDHIQEALQAVGDAPSKNGDVVRIVFANLLFAQAKALNGEGLYGRAASNIMKSAMLLLKVAEASVCVLKLLGDVYSFAFYLAPLHFNSVGWIEFIVKGKTAYKGVLALLEGSGAESSALAEAHYDLGVSNWYEARARSSIKGAPLDPFAGTRSKCENDLSGVIETARVHLCAALKLNPAFSLAWNALGVVLQHPLAKQFSWVRAIQSANLDAAWANLGMFYVHQGTKQSAQLARSAFLHLQGVNTNNPAMWIGYSMLHLQQNTSEGRLRAREGFRCALEMGYHLDALFGFVLSASLSALDSRTSSDSLDGIPTDEELLFAIKKYLEREPLDARAWCALASTQLQLGLIEEAARSATKCVQFADGTMSQNGVKCNENLLHHIVKANTEPTTGIENMAQLLESAPGNKSSGVTSAALLRAISALASNQKQKAMEAVSCLLCDEAVGALECVGAAIVGLAIAARCVNTHSNEAQALNDACTAVILGQLGSGMLPEAAYQSLELFHRSNATLTSFVQLFGDSLPKNANASGSSMRLQGTLAMMDLGEYVPVDNLDGLGLDRDYLRALKNLQSPDVSAHKAQNLVRLQPGNPYAYALVVLELLKSEVFDQRDTKPGKRLETALRLSSIGRAVVSPAASPFGLMALHWATALVTQRLGRVEDQVAHAQKALDFLLAIPESTALTSEDRAVWKARLFLLLGKNLKAWSSYHEALEGLRWRGSDARVLTILMELGSAYEYTGWLDQALHVWKVVAGHKNSAGDTVNSAQFVGNVRLALVHGKKGNTKTAKKFSKAAVALVTGDAIESTPVVTQQATVAHFVEAAIAKM